MWTVKITTVNVNGIRAAHRKGMPAWLASEQPDVLLLQEVRATDEIVAELLGEDWHIVHQACDIKGRAGVAIGVNRCCTWPTSGSATATCLPAPSGQTNWAALTAISTPAPPSR